ncbi:MAG TPA: hypothetical protein VK636_04750 [Gemmatimonadaceae bacterium]|nr:hypothetical protein [Gemmatimonadaceae bacterium]
MMKMRKRWVPAALLMFASAACFHQVVETGRTPSATIVDNEWVPTWIFGLVAAPEIDTRRQCPTGVAIVESETSFMNGIVSIITIGIFTPQHVKVTCASGTAMLPPGAKEFRIPVEATAEQRSDIVGRAIEQSNETHAPVVLRF